MKIALRTAISGLLATALAGPTVAHAVRLDADGVGQALIYPYYTVRSAGGAPFHTYLSIVNHSSDAKALRVRARAAYGGASVASFNLFLGPNDAWTGAITPTSMAARLVTEDASCTDPPMQPLFGGVPPPGDLPGITFQMPQPTSPADADSTREGFVEILEMATLTGASASAAAEGASGLRASCDALRPPVDATLAPPTGGLSGTLTLINVATGLDFTLNAVALADLATRPYFSPPTSFLSDFDSDEIDPVSVVVANGALYRSTWARPIEAVSAVLMRDSWAGEYTLDAGTASLTDLVLTFPTRRLHGGTSPFAGNDFGPEGYCPDRAVRVTWFDRAQASETPGLQPFLPTGTDRYPVCASTAVLSVRNSAPHVPVTSNVSHVFGSLSSGIHNSAGMIPDGFRNGWIRFEVEPGAVLTSQPSSVRIDLATGAQATGVHQFTGLPVIGFSARTFANGTLACGAGGCQGNYGGAFPLTFTRKTD